MPLALVVLQLGLIVAALGLGGYLFISLKQDIARTDKRQRTDALQASAQIAGLRLAIGELKKDLDSLPSAAPLVPGSGINLNRRTQALRISRMGEGPEHIAAALQIPRREVDLLMKVQHMLLESAAQPITE